MPRGDRLERARLDQRNELHHPRTDLTREKAVDVQRPPGVLAVDDRQGVEGDAVFLQPLGGGEDAVERGLAPLGHAVGVVQVFRAVDAEADEEMVLAEEAAPGVVQQDAVGLQAVEDPLAVGAVLLLQVQDLAEEVDAQEGRLAALPLEFDLRGVVVGDVIADELLQHSSAMGWLPESPSSRSLPR